MKFGTYVVAFILGVLFTQAVFAAPAAPSISPDRLKEIWDPKECTENPGKMIYCYEILNALVEGASPSSQEIFALIPAHMLSEDFEVLIDNKGQTIYKNSVVVAVRRTEAYFKKMAVLLHTDRRLAIKQDNEFKKRFYPFVLDKSQKADELDFASVEKKLLERLMNRTNQVAMITNAVTKFLNIEGDPYARVEARADESKASLDFNLNLDMFFNNGKAQIVSVKSNAQLEKLGVAVGDELISVDGVAVTPEAYHDISQRVQKSGGKREIVYKIKKSDSEEVVDYKERVSKQPIPAVDAYQFEVNGRQVGVISLHTFMKKRVCLDVKKHLNQLLKNDQKKKAIEALVLDLRENDGGLVNEALCISGLFLGENKPVLKEVLLESGLLYDTLKEETPLVQISSTPEKIKQVLPLEIPVSIVVNTNSVSAAEMTPAILRHFERAWIVGQRTYGKGIVQAPFNYNRGKGLDLWATTSRYEMMNGFSPHLIGVLPDFAVNSPVAGLDGEKMAARFIDEDGPAFSSTTTPESFSEARLEQKKQIDACVDGILVNQKQGPQATRFLKDLQFKRAAEVALCALPKSN